MMRPQVVARSVRTVGRRANSSSAKTQSPLDHPQVKQAADQVSAVYNKGADAVKKVAGPVGDKIGSALGGYREPLKYNWNVFTSLCRQIYKAESLAPPTQASQWANAYASIFSKGASGAWWKGIFENGQWAKVGVYGLEAYGIYKIGEIIGKRNLIGYKVKKADH